MRFIGLDTIFGDKTKTRATSNRSSIAYEIEARKTAGVDTRFKTPAWEFDRRKTARWEFEGPNKVA
jgi:hypothetical protein